MMYAMKQTALGLAVSALALTVGGCASTPKENTISYSQPDEKIIGPQPPRANTIYGMTRLMRAQGKTDQAELALIGLMKEFPNYSPTYNDLAEIRIAQGRYEEAEHYIDAGLQVAPRDAVLLNNAGVCSLIKHDYPKALDYFQRASLVAPYETRYRANVALAMGLTGDIQGSRALYLQIVSPEQAEHNAKLIESLLAPQKMEAIAPREFALLAPQIPAGSPETLAAPDPVTTEETILSNGATADQSTEVEQEQASDEEELLTPEE